MRYLGVDYGSRKVGLALSDEAGTIGFPHDIIANTPRLAGMLRALIARENVGAVVIGKSRTLAGGDNPIAHAAHALGEALEREAGVPVAYESEVFTTVEAKRLPEPFFAPDFAKASTGKKASQGSKPRKSRAAKRRADVDASAAALILTSYLSRIHHGT